MAQTCDVVSFRLVFSKTELYNRRVGDRRLGMSKLRTIDAHALRIVKMNNPGN